MILWPKQRFKGLKKELLFLNKFPVYDSLSSRVESYRDGATVVSQSTMALVAEIFANYIQFYMEREVILKNLKKYDFSPASLFE